MDGNGRWATRRGLPRFAGHEAGVEAIRRVMEAAPDQGVGTLTLYAFSSDNWRRPEAEVTGLMTLLRRYLRNETQSLVRNECSPDRDRPARSSSLRAGRRDRARGRRRLRAAMPCTCGSRSTTRRAMRSSTPQRNAAGLTSSRAQSFAQLVTGQAELRDVDLVIRTSGEKRLSDFLLWESAYAELHFTERMWPDFNADDLADALASFRRRERRFGGLQCRSRPNPHCASSSVRNFACASSSSTCRIPRSAAAFPTIICRRSACSRSADR